MTLRPLLTDTFSINILKYLSDQEKNNRLSVSIPTLKEKLGKNDYNVSIEVLEKNNLIGKDEDNLTITNQGKEFIETFDKLISLTKEKEKPKKRVKVVYELEKKEQKVLLTIQKLSKQAETEFIPIRLIAKELYPGQDFAKKVSYISKLINKIEELNFVLKKKEDNLNLVALTDKGKELLKEQILETIF